MINNFSGNYAFLSNFYPSPIKFKEGPDELTAPTAEHFFQYLKTPSTEEGMAILTAETPGKAKSLGRKCILHKDWEITKDAVMLRVLREKFTQHPHLADMLVRTSSRFLVEGNEWNDTYWGVCGGEGRNMLGHLLMQVRDELRRGLI